MRNSKATDGHKQLHYKCVRVETLNHQYQKLGGIISPVIAILHVEVDLHPSAPEDELAAAIEQRMHIPEVKTLYDSLALLGSIPIPEIYNENHRHYCFYKETYFEKIEPVVDSLSPIFQKHELYIGKLYAKIDKENVLYQDKYQVVISESAYRLIEINTAFLPG